MNEQKVEFILTDLIDLPQRQMRRDIDRDELFELAENIRKNGLINPITVRPRGERYELVAGQRRLLACGIARIIRVPCVIRELNDGQAVAVMASENLERRDVNILDEANFIKTIIERENISTLEMAERLNRSIQYVKDRLVVAEMPDYMQELIKSERLKLGVALALVQIEEDDKRRMWVTFAVDNRASVYEAEWWLEQHRLGLLPSVLQKDTIIPTAPDGTRQELMFQCVVDGKEYPASECKAVFAYKGNLPYLAAMRSELSALPDETRQPVGGNQESAAVAAG